MAMPSEKYTLFVYVSYLYVFYTHAKYIDANALASCTAACFLAVLCLRRCTVQDVLPPNRRAELQLSALLPAGVRALADEYQAL